MPIRSQSRWILILFLVLGIGPCVAQAQDLWLMKAHDTRRTGQSQSNGPLPLDPTQSWTAEAPGAHTLNIGATVTARGVFFGSWGLLRRDPQNPDPCAACRALSSTRDPDSFPGSGHRTVRGSGSGSLVDESARHAAHGSEPEQRPAPPRPDAVLDRRGAGRAHAQHRRDRHLGGS